MASDHGGSRQPDDPHWYRFWSGSTAARARSTGRPREVIDRRVRHFFQELCERVEPTVVLELGAHEAGFSRWAKESFPHARCLALEANPYVFRKHREKLARAGVEYHNLAAAERNGTVTVNIPLQVGDTVKSHDNRMGSLAVHGKASETEMVEVEAIRVDDFVALADDDRVVAWIDVEGASDVVLRGGSEVLARADAIYIEVESNETWSGQWLDVDVARFFRSLGLVPAIRDIQRLHQYNVIFVGAPLAEDEEVHERVATVFRHRPVIRDPEPPSRSARTTAPFRRWRKAARRLTGG